MISPAQAILWQIFWRARFGLAAAGAFLLMAILFSHTLPRHWTIQMNDDQVPAVGWFLGVSCLFLNVMLMATFAMSGTDARDLVFVKHMFVLPVRTSTLVRWPMLSGCLTVSAVWLIDAIFVYRATGIAAPIWWPAAAFSLFLATIQALAWTPFAQRWLHVVLTAAVLISPLLVMLVVLAFNVKPSEPVAAALLLGLLPVAYVAAVSGVSRARRGEPYDWRAWGRFVEWLARWRPPVRHPFRSLNRAQLWYECRAHLIVPVFIACMLPCFLFVPALERSNVELGWKLLGIMLGAPLLVGMLSGGALGNLTDPLSKSESRTFVLARPITNLAIIRGKLLLAAIVTGTIWLLFLGVISLLLLRPGFTDSIGQVASSVPLWKAIGFPLLILVLLVAFTWKIMIENLWVTLSGRKWVENTMAFGFMSLLFIGIGAGLWLAFHPEWHATALAAVPWLIGGLLATKLAAAALVVRGLLRFGLTGPSGAAMMIAAWLAIVVSLCTLAFGLLPPEYATVKNIVPSIAFFIPFARVAGTPLALEWGRHQ